MDNLKTFLIFITIVLLIYGGVNYYLYRRILQAAGIGGWSILILKLVLLVIILAYPLGHTFGSASKIGSICIWVGAFWLGVMVYGLLIALAVDLVKLGDLFFGWMPNKLNLDRVLTGRILLAVSAVAIFMLLLSGHIRSLYPIQRDIELEILSSDVDEYRIAVFADTHLGVLVGERRFRRLVEQVNLLEPDLILIIGDLIDENPERFQWVKELLQELKAKDGTFFVTGNHEYYNGLEVNLELLKNAGITTLQDEAVEIDNTLILAGLNDVTGSRQFSIESRPIETILDGRNKDLPVVLMHHTPTRKEEAQAGGVDLMICGHTHGGQIWPFGLFTRLIYNARQGLSRFGKMSFYLTNGAGTWGPPVRIGASPEIVHFILKPRAGE